jgi:hypothetical protein
MTDTVIRAGVPDDIDAMVDGHNELGVGFWSAIGFTVPAHEDRRCSSLV